MEYCHATHCLSLPGPAAPFVHQCHLPGKLIDLGLLSSNNFIGPGDATSTGGVSHQWTRGRWRSGCGWGCGGVGGVVSRGTDDPRPLIAATVMDSVVRTLLQAALLSCAVDLIHDEVGLHLSKGRVQCGPGPTGTEAQHGAHHLGISPVPAVITEHKDKVTRVNRVRFQDLPNRLTLVEDITHIFRVTTN